MKKTTYLEFNGSLKRGREEEGGKEGDRKRREEEGGRETVGGGRKGRGRGKRKKNWQERGRRRKWMC